MTSRWFRSRLPRIDADELRQTAEESLKETRGQQAHVNTITSYLNARTGQNGFGEDFEITLTPRSA